MITTKNKFYKQKKHHSDMQSIGEIIERTSWEDFVEYGKTMMVLRDLQARFNKSESIFERRDIIRTMYAMKNSILNDAYNIGVLNWIDPYFLDWDRIFTPIEQQAWNLIRSLGRIVMYPQFPVGRFFIDFANPFMKLGLEVDGKIHDREKDVLRDTELRKLGWKIFHVPGVECMREYIDGYELAQMDEYSEEYFDARENLYMNTLEGVIRAMRIIYFDTYCNEDTLRLSYRTLDRHSLIDGIELPCVYSNPF